MTAVAPSEASVEDRFAKSLLAVAFVRVLVVSAGLGLAFWQLDASAPDKAASVAVWQYVVIGVAYGTGLVVVLALKMRRYLPGAAFLQVVADTATVGVVVVLSGGAESVFVFMFVLVTLEASVTLLRPGAAVAIGLGTVVYGGILLAQGLGLSAYLPPPSSQNLLPTFFVHTLGMGLVGLLASGLASKLHSTGRQLAEREEDLLRLGELQGAILAALPAGLLTVDESGRIQYGNASAHAILRIPPRGLVGRPVHDVLPGVSLSRRMARQELAVVLGDGAMLRIGFSSAPLTDRENSGMVLVFQDLTEVARLEVAVQRAERLAVVGRFAAGLAHEVRNPLAAICASIDVLEQSIDPPEPMKRLMANVVREAARLDRLIQDFLALARPRTLCLERVDLSSVVRGVLEVFAHEGALEELAVESDIQPQVEAVIDSDLLRQVLWNLLRNAGEAMRGAEERRLWVQLRLGPDGPEIEIRDTGIGLDEGVRRRVFEPFFSTKPSGSGLGLAISQSIVHAHGGSLDLEGLSQGAAATIRLPRDAPSVRLTMQDPTPIPRTGGAGVFKEG